MGLNKVILQGNVVADPELKSTTTGTMVATFRIAVGRRFTKQNEETKSDFFNIVAWRNTGEFVAKNFCKGKGIVVVGSLQNRDYTTPDGQKRYITEVIADEVYFAGSKENMTPGQKTEQHTTTPKFEDISTDEELPF